MQRIQFEIIEFNNYLQHFVSIALSKVYYGHLNVDGLHCKICFLWTCPFQDLAESRYQTMSSKAIIISIIDLEQDLYCSL